MKKFSKKLQNTMRLAIFWPNLLDNLIFYLIETMLKPTETSKKNLIFERKKIKLQKSM